MTEQTKKFGLKAVIVSCCFYALILAVIISRLFQGRETQYIGVARTFDLRLKEPVHIDDTPSDNVDVMLVPVRVNSLECLLLLDTGPPGLPMRIDHYCIHHQ